MNRRLLALTLAGLVLALVACKKADQASTTASPAPVPPADAAMAGAPPDSTAANDVAGLAGPAGATAATPGATGAATSQSIGGAAPPAASGR